MTLEPWIFLIISALFSILLFAFLFFYFRNFIIIKQKLLSTETELTKVHETERIQSVALMNLKNQFELSQPVDALTGLVTQQVFEDRLKQILTQSRRHQLVFAILLVNLNEFKIMTSALGFEAGDFILKETAKRIQQSIRQLDTVARLEGNDFGLILPQLIKSETAAYVAQRIVDIMTEPFILNGKEIFVSASIGMAIYPNDGDNEKVLMKNAETALHQAIVHGHHVYQFYRVDMQLESKREFVLHLSLQDPSVVKDFLIYYQPILDLEKHQIFAMQVKLRWNHIDCGLLEYNDFVKLAEGNGTIVRIGEWLLRQVCQQLQLWKTSGYKIQAMAMDVSPRQLENPHFSDKVSKIFKEYQVQPGTVLFEIAESAMTSRIGVSEKTLLMLKELGVQVGISDFGIGNMVLWRLQGLNVDHLKIAESIIKSVTYSSETIAVVKMIVAFAHTLGLQVLSEGVETDKQIQTLKDLGCTLMQGDIFCKPLLAGEFTPLVEKKLLENIS